MATGLQSAAIPYDKPMDDEHRKILKESRQALVEDMEPQMVLRQMIDPHLFTEDEKDRIMANNLTRQQQNERLLDILPRKGAGAYEVFKETIKKAHRPLLTILVEADAPDCGEKNEEHEVTKSSEEIYKKPTNEKEVTKELQQRVAFEELQKLEEERKILQEKIRQREETIGKLGRHLDNKQKRLEKLKQKVDELANDETLRMKNNVRKNEEEIKEPGAKKQQKKKQAEASGMREDEGDKLHEERREEEDRINKYTSRICKLS